MGRIVSGMTSKRLAEIRERANLQCGLDGDDADDLLAHVDHLTAEVTHLQNGVNMMHLMNRGLLKAVPTETTEGDRP